MAKTKKKIRLIFLLVVSFICLAVVFVLDYFYKNYDFIFRVLEIVLTIVSTILSTTSLTINFTSERTQDSFINSNDNTQIQLNGKGTLIVNNQSNNSLVAALKTIETMSTTIQKDNLNKIIEKVHEISAKENFEALCTPSKDFFLKYLSEASLISSDDLQEIWARLLIQKCKNRDGVSKRTLDIVKNMDSSEAALFSKYLEFSLDNGIIYKSICNDDVKKRFMNVSKLQDIGLLKSGEFLNYNIEINSSDESTIVNSNVILIIRNTGVESQKISFDCYALTSTGLEIKNALNKHMKQDLFLDFCRKIKDHYASNKNLQFSAHIINDCKDGIADDQSKDILK